MIDQSTIRSKIQKERAQLSKEEQSRRSKKICSRIIQSDILSDALNIAIYLPVRGEADPTFLENFKEISGKSFYLPILSQINNNHLEFALYNKHTVMKLNRFNIPEPDPNSAQVLSDPRKLDVVIMPMVAIDALGNRIGMGGGFYDRTFAFKKIQSCKPNLIAFAYDFQLIEEQTPQSWDVPADSIALENQLIRMQ